MIYTIKMLLLKAYFWIKLYADRVFCCLWLLGLEGSTPNIHIEQHRLLLLPLVVSQNLKIGPYHWR